MTIYLIVAHLRPLVSHFNCAALLIICVLICSPARGQQGGILHEDDDGMSGTIQFGGPEDLNDEMMQSPFVPNKAEMKCDACKAVAHQLWVGFEAYNKKHRSLKYNVPESELIDLLEECCADVKTWEGYGMKKIKKVTRLSGPGLVDTVDVPGVTASGGKWPNRLRDMCESYVGELGETTLYKVYRSRPGDDSKLVEYLCRGRQEPRTRCAHERKEEPRGRAGEL